MVVPIWHGPAEWVEALGAVVRGGEVDPGTWRRTSGDAVPPLGADGTRTVEITAGRLGAYLLAPVWDEGLERAA